MFKRRLAVLGTVGVLALAGLGGSALADGTPAPDATAATTVTTAAVSCRTPDGKEIKLADGPVARVFVMRAEKGERADGAPELKAERGRVIELAPGTVTEATPTTPSVPAAPAAPQAGTEAAPTTPSATLPEGEAAPAAPSAPLPEGEAARMLPALPATELPPGAVKLDDPGKVVHIVCASAEPAK
ncbi:hypothetical protein [Nonomuraea sp. NPDC049684]|uniref:hypothetical protein n=1 Tax=Nonomuraea sp. NPDC049684 TaxID=3364356 RepID=UPI00379A6C95